MHDGLIAGLLFALLTWALRAEGKVMLEKEPLLLA